MRHLDKIMIADSSDETAKLLGHWLTREGYTEIYTANTGSSALFKAKLIQPDVVIANVVMPDMSGFDFCKILKSQNPYVLILCISHLTSEHMRVRAMAAGADDYIDTGDISVFLSKIRSLFKVKHLGMELRKQYEELEAREKLLERHMEMGRRIQRVLIPDIDMKFNDMHIRSIYRPAYGLGGDFYIVNPLNDSSLAIVMGDVSGHGVASAFLTTTLIVMIKDLQSRYTEPGTLLFHLNKQVSELFGGEDIYACVFYAVLDTIGQTIRFANAGLTLPLLFDHKTTNLKELEASGQPVGMLPDAKYDESGIFYNKGDMLLFYTDGLSEFYYKNQPEEFLRQIKAHLNSSTDVLESIYRNFTKEEASQLERMEMDDISMMLCKL